VPLSLFATARRHWTWLRGVIERHCQFSREARLHWAKFNEGSCTPSLGYLLSPLASHTQVDLCVFWRERSRDGNPLETVDGAVS